MVCSKCKTAVPDDGVFCGVCGSKIIKKEKTFIKKKTVKEEKSTLNNVLLWTAVISAVIVLVMLLTEKIFAVKISKNWIIRNDIEYSMSVFTMYDVVCILKDNVKDLSPALYPATTVIYISSVCAIVFCGINAYTGITQKTTDKNASIAACVFMTVAGVTVIILSLGIKSYIKDTLNMDESLFSCSPAIYVMMFFATLNTVVSILHSKNRDIR